MRGEPATTADSPARRTIASTAATSIASPTSKASEQYRFVTVARVRRDFPGQGQVGGLGRADVLDAALADESDDALEEIEETPGAGVDDTGPGQDGQLLGRVGERSLGDGQGVGQQLGEVGHLLALFVEGFGPVVENGDHRALDGRHDGPAGVLDGPPRALGEPADRQAVLAADLLAQTVEELGEDQAGIAPGPDQGRVGDGTHGGGGGPVGPGLFGDRPHRRGEIGPGVGIRHGEDVDPVEIGLVADDRLAAGEEGVVEAVAVEIADLHLELSLSPSLL